MNNLIITTNTCLSIKNTNKLFIKARLLNTIQSMDDQQTNDIHSFTICILNTCAFLGAGY